MTESEEIESLRAIPEKLRPNYLVGAFLNYFAFMELALDEAIGAMLGLSPLRALAVTSNTNFAAKITMFKTLASLASEEQRGRLTSLASGLHAANLDRIVAAHRPFGPSESTDGVTFIVMMAKEKFSFPKTDWSVQQFASKIRKMDDVAEQLRASAATKAYSAVATALAGKSLSQAEGVFGALFEAGASLGRTGDAK